MSSDPAKFIRITAYFTGRVQGVGFRHHAYQASKSFDVTGTVQNLDDGRVKVVVEGERSVLECFLDRVGHPTAGHVSKVQHFESEASKEFSDFQVIR